LVLEAFDPDGEIDVSDKLRNDGKGYAGRLFRRDASPACNKKSIHARKGSRLLLRNLI